MARHDDGQLPERVRDLAAPAAAPLGVEILEVAVKGQPGRRVVRITADASALDADANLDIDTIARLSRAIGDALDDEQDLIPGAYTLEVTSPGADRPLRTSRDFARNVGRDVLVVRAIDDDRSQLSGRLLGATDDDITIEVDGDQVVVPFADLDHGKVVLPW